MINLRRNFELEDVLLLNLLNLNDKEKETVREWRNHETVRKWMYSDHIISIEEHNGFIEGLKKDNKNYYWLAKCKNKESLGIISLTKLDSTNKNAYLGIYANPFGMIQGVGHVLVGCVKQLAFEITDLHTLKLEVIETNEKAIKFYNKSGFVEEGRLREFVIKDGKWLDVIIMGIRNSNSPGQL